MHHVDKREIWIGLLRASAAAEREQDGSGFALRRDLLSLRGESRQRRA
jgi:hypothetical protein